MADYTLSVSGKADMKDVTDSLQDITQKLEDISKSASNSKEKTSVFGDVLKANFVSTAITGGLHKIAEGIKAISKAAVNATKDVIGTGAGFEKAMSQVQATYGISAQDIQSNTNGAGDAMKGLTKLARDLGSTTKFTASEAADGMNVLAMAGLSAEQQFETLPDVLDLAAAGGISIAEAADYTTGVLATFGAQGETASTVADVLAQTSTKAKGSVADFGAGLSAAAAQAVLTGQNLTDTATALGILGNANFGAAEGGNALNRILKNLYQSTDKGKETLDELGVSVYDSAGKARRLPDVLTDLQKALSGMNDEAKNEKLSQIFDAVTLKSAPALLNAQTGAWQELSTAIGEFDGAAGKMAETQEDNLLGLFTKIGSAADDVKQSLYTGIKGPLTTLATTAQNSLSQFATALQGVDFNTIANNMKPALDAITGLMTTLTEKAINFVQTTDWTAVGIQITSAVNQVITAISTFDFAGFLDKVGQAISGIWNFISNIDFADLGEKLNTVAEHGGTILNVIAGIAGLGIGAKIGTFIAGVMETIASLGGLSGIIASVGGALGTIGEVILGVATGPVGIIIAAVAGAIAIFTNWDKISKFFQGVWEKLWPHLQSLVEGFQKFFGPIMEAIRNTWNTVWTAIKNNPVVQAIFTFVKIKFELMKTVLSTIWTGIKTAVNAAWNTIKKYIINPVKEIYDNTIGKFKKTKEETGSTFEAMAEVIRGIFTGLITSAINFGGSIISGIKDGLSGLTDTVKSAFSGALDFFEGLPAQALTWGSDICSSIANGITGAIGWVQNAAGNIASQIASFLHFSEPDVGPLSNFHTFMPDMISMMSDGIKRNLPTLTGAVNLAANVVSTGISPEMMTAGTTSGNVYGDTNRSVSYGANNITIVQQPGENSEDLADRVIDRITDRIRREEATYE